jgi:formate/nitrite transporter FocA (FNT family)
MPEATSSKHSIDAYSPTEIAALVEQGGVRKAALSGLQTLTLGVLAGAFIAFGAMFYTLIVGGSLCVALVYWIVYLRPSEPGRR